MITIVLGDTINFGTVFDYQGPIYNASKMRVSIGKRNSFTRIFDELLSVDEPLSMPLTSAWTRYSMTVFITAASPLVAGNTYDLEAKIYEGLSIYQLWKDDGALQIVVGSPTPTFRNLAVVYSKV